MIVRAYEAAARAHQGQLRNSGEAYISHPLAVATILAGLGPRRRDHRGRPAARRGRGHRLRPDRDRGRVRPGRGGHRRRRHQAGPGPLRLPAGAAGGDHAQDAGRHGQGPPGPAHQAGRPAAQHADHRGHARVEAEAQRPGDPRHLRPAGPPLRHPGHQVAARGPGLRRPAPPALRRDRADGRHPRPRAGHLPGPGDRPGQRAPRSPPASRPRSPAGPSTCTRSTRRWSSRARSSTRSTTWSGCGSSSTR